jgi:hypothetical protein
MHAPGPLAKSLASAAALLALLFSAATAHRVSDETARVKAHLRAAHDYVSQHDVSGLSEDQRRRRAERLADLDEYIERAVFPENTEFADMRAPYFVDRSGTRCAVAHMVEASGRTDLVARLAGKANNAYVPELARDAELVAWLDQNGLTAAEAAIIQPSYEPVCIAKVDCICAHSRAQGPLPEPSAVVHARVKDAAGPAVFTVLDVAGDAPGVTPGGELTLDIFVPDTYSEVLLRLRRFEGADEYDIVLRIEDDQVACRHISEDLTLDSKIAMDALLAGDDCEARVLEANPDFAGSHGGGCGGCRCSSAAPPGTTLWLLLLVPFTLFLRRSSS